MPELCAAKVIHIFFLLTVVLDVSYCYKTFSMEMDAICHQFSAKTTYKLPDAANAAAIVEPGHKFDRWEVTLDTLCKFVFKTHSHTSLFAVIQNMSLRHNGSQCIDWIQFKGDNHRSKQFCGTAEYGNMRNYVSEVQGVPESLNLGPSNVTSHMEFKSVKGDIETSIFISKEKLQPGEILDLTIVYTPYKDCEKLKDKSKYRLNSNNTCIAEEFYCDKYKNCAFDSCLDEVGCEVVGNGTGTKVTVGALTTLFLSFLLFVMCLWTCRKHKKLCWSADCAGPNIDGDNSQSADSRQRDPSGRSVIPTAPMLEERTARPVHDKDLPPSYDSLFPDQVVVLPAAT